MCEYGKQCSCENCSHAVKENYFVVGCAIEDEMRRRDEEMLRRYEEDAVCDV